MTRRRIKSQGSNLLQAEAVMKQKRKKNPEISYTLEELHQLSEDKFMFLSLILNNKWMNAIYMGHNDYDRKLHFIRTWYNSRKPGANPDQIHQGPEQKTLF